MANAPIVVAEGDEEIEVEYDSDGNPIVSEKSKVIDPLPPVDHSTVRRGHIIDSPPPPPVRGHVCYNRSMLVENYNATANPMMGKEWVEYSHSDMGGV